MKKVRSAFFAVMILLSPSLLVATGSGNGVEDLKERIQRATSKSDARNQQVNFPSPQNEFGALGFSVPILLLTLGAFILLKRRNSNSQ